MDALSDIVNKWEYFQTWFKGVIRRMDTGQHSHELVKLRPGIYQHQIDIGNYSLSRLLVWYCWSGKVSVDYGKLVVVTTRDCYPPSDSHNLLDNIGRVERVFYICRLMVTRRWKLKKVTSRNRHSLPRVACINSTYYCLGCQTLSPRLRDWWMGYSVTRFYCDWRKS